jgi:cob(I)alamin adenosyltransferase
MTTNTKYDSTTHKRMAEKRNEGYQKKQAKATTEKGLLIINTGTGKGKSTAAFGMGLRAVGHGMKLGVVQFIKGAMGTAEREIFKCFNNVDFQSIGDGFTWLTQNREQDIATAEKAWAEAERMLSDASYDMIILDELNIILKYEYLDLSRVLNTLAQRREMLHVVVTGRHAPPELIDMADLVSDIRSIKHPYKEQGVKAQKGIEF